jgi:hypothetical protein
MKREDLANAVLNGWAQLDEAGRDKFFHEFLRAALRLERLDVREWHRRRLRAPPLLPVDLSGVTLSDADIAALLKPKPRP